MEIKKLAASFGKTTTTSSPLCESLLNIFVRKHDTQFSSYYCSEFLVCLMCVFTVGQKRL